MHWRRKWQPPPVFLPGEYLGWGAWWAVSMGLHRVRHDCSDLAAAWMTQCTVLSQITLRFKVFDMESMTLFCTISIIFVLLSVSCVAF